ncbi:MAG: hypothetical protein A2Y15_04095 [Clostridiales bacterium GWF2_36_10]|nr:MAG: hypothetical protein A2Y15_04095 [Clostridiales bacterium GWF2_36_10]HAN20820.1 hypothetical protein [Clostridiales bacterium]
MKMILTLTKNEYIKLFRKKSVPILLLLLVLLVFGISLIKPYNYYYYTGDYYGESNHYGEINFSEYRNNFTKSIVSESQLQNYPENQKAYTIVLNDFYKRQIELCDKAEDLGINDTNDWRYLLIGNLLNSSYEVYFYEYIASGGEYADIIKNYLGYNNIYYKNQATAQAGYLQAIETNDYSESKRGFFEDAKSKFEEYDVKLKEAESKKSNGTGGEDIDHEIFKLKGILNCYESLKETYNNFLSKKYEYRSDEDKTVTLTAQAFNQVINSYQGFMSEIEYNNPEDENSFDYPIGYSSKYEGVYYNSQWTYEEYYDQAMASINDNLDKGNIGLYSLQNDVIELSVTNASRSKSLSFVNLFWLIAPMAIFFASGMVSKEFSTKTINLLLIRPVKRWKILLSKYLCLLSLVAGMLVVTCGIYMLGSGIRLGFADFSQPYLYIFNGTVHSANFVLWLIGKVFIASLPILCLISITFMFSSVTKGNAVSLILGVLTLFSSILILMFAGLFRDTSALTYMPFPYFSMWSYVFDDMVSLSHLEVNPFGQVVTANLTYGTLLLTALTVISITAAFIDFNKKDVK